MAVVTVYPRHSKRCDKSKGKNARQYKRCKCPLWLEWNENGCQSRKSAKTRSWEIANRCARNLEQELDLKAVGMEPPKKTDHITWSAVLTLQYSAARFIWSPRRFVGVKGIKTLVGNPLNVRSRVPPKPVGGFQADRGVGGQDVQIRPNLVLQQLPDLGVPQHSQPTL